MKKLLSDHWKRYLWSSLMTFLAGFLMAVVPELESLELESLRDGSLVGLVFVGIRTGLKLVLEVALAKLKK